MKMSEGIFYILGILSVICGTLVISSNNPIHSVFYLVLVFASGSVLLILLGIEFLSVLLMIVYVGAIAILFLFVVMMLNIKLVEYIENTSRYVPIGFIIGIIFIYEMYKLVSEEIISAPLEGEKTAEYIKIWTQTNIGEIGSILYTEYVVWFIVASMILLVAMLGAIVLTLGHGEGIKRQDIYSQIGTNPEETVRLKC